MPRRVLQGVVVSSKANKTITVEVESNVMHPMYRKYIKRHKKYAAHDEANVCQVGQVVRIVECAPISKTKKWVVETN
ncbi:MAG: 30S ribosomal protein S17 [Holosporales bacterium]